MSEEEPITEEIFKKYIEYLYTLTGAELISQLKIRKKGEEDCSICEKCMKDVSEEEFNEIWKNLEKGYIKKKEEAYERSRRRTHRTLKEA